MHRQKHAQLVIYTLHYESKVHEDTILCCLLQYYSTTKNMQEQHTNRYILLTTSI